MSRLQLLFAERMNAGLSRKSVTTASRWAEKYRFMSAPFPGLWQFKHHPWLYEMHNSEHPMNIGQKAAQLGFTEMLLNRVFYTIDVKRMDVLYILPNTRPDAADFSASRFDKALELSDHLKAMFSDVNNVGHKRAGSVNLFIRGSNSRPGLKSIPVSFIAFDEVDEMEQKNIPLAMERTAGQVEKFVWMISTPTIEDHGINKFFKNSTQEHFFFPCPGCNKFIELKYPESFVLIGDTITDPRIGESHYICTECRRILREEEKTTYLQKAIWKATASGSNRGFYCNQMYSTTIKPKEIAEKVFMGQSNEFDEQELYNSKLGLTHAPESAKITDQMIGECIGNYTTKSTLSGGMITMGIDVGKKLHVEIDLWNVDTKYNTLDINIVSTPKVMWYGTLTEFEQLDRLMIDYQVRFAVIDCAPEGRKAREFARRFYGFVRLCRFTSNAATKELKESEEEDLTVLADRTSWLDLALGRYKRGKDGITLPQDINAEYREQIKAPSRVPLKDRDGNPIARYITSDSVQDHYAFSRVYAEIALACTGNIQRGKNVSRRMI